LRLGVSLLLFFGSFLLAICYLDLQTPARMLFVIEVLTLSVLPPFTAKSLASTLGCIILSFFRRRWWTSPPSPLAMPLSWPFQDPHVTPLFLAFVRSWVTYIVPPNFNSRYSHAHNGRPIIDRLFLPHISVFGFRIIRRFWVCFWVFLWCLLWCCGGVFFFLLVVLFFVWGCGGVFFFFFFGSVVLCGFFFFFSLFFFCQISWLRCKILCPRTFFYRFLR